MSNYHHNDEDNASLSSEDSQEPYYHIETGKIIPAREAWSILAREGHPRFSKKLSSVSDENNTIGLDGADKNDAAPGCGNDDSGSGNSNTNTNGNNAMDDIFRSRLNTGSSEGSSGANSTSLASGVVAGRTKSGTAIVNITASTAASMAIDQATQNVAAGLETNPTEDSLNETCINEDTDMMMATTIEQTSSFSSAGGEGLRGPSQSSIDRALHPDGIGTSPNPLSPKSANANNNAKHNPDHNTAGGHITSDDDDEEDDPIVLRAKAMALAAKNGAKLTPKQMLLIAQPDVQQQKLIEEARRRGQQQQHHSSLGGNFERIGADFKKFIETEKEKGPMQWGADLGKFIEEQKSSLKLSSGGQEGVGGKEVGDVASSTTGMATSASLSDAMGGGKILKKKMEGFGTDPFAPTPPSEGENDVTPKTTTTTKSILDSMMPVLPGTSKKSSAPSTPSKQHRKAVGEGGETPSLTPHTPGKSSIFMSIPPLPTLPTLSGSTISSILPGGGDKFGDQTLPQDEVLKISGILWKRRSGMGKHSSKAWEKRRVELRGAKLMYYKTVEEEQEEKRTGVQNASVIGGRGVGLVSSTILPVVRDDSLSPNETLISDSTATTPFNNTNNSELLIQQQPPPPMTASTKRYSIFEHAAQAAEQKLQNAKDEFSRMSVTLGIEKPSSADAPRGILDICKEKASVAASIGHSGSPTPFCISVKVKSETKWKFCFENHGDLMAWLAALTDVVVQSSVDGTKGGGLWEMEDYCIRRGAGKENDEDAGNELVSKSAVDTVASRKLDAPIALGQQAIPVTADEVSTAKVAIVTQAKNLEATQEDRIATLSDDESQWMISGMNLNIACAIVNGAMIMARSRSTSIDKYWMMVVFANFGIWQLCSRPKKLAKVVSERSIKPTPVFGPRSPQRKEKQSSGDESLDKLLDDNSVKPIAGTTTIKVANVDDSSVTKNGFQFPTWLTVSSSGLDVRSHGYLSTKKKVPSPGELYECVAVDCFASYSRVSDIAPRVALPDANFADGDSKKTWKCPDIFVVSVAIPTEAPKIGRSTDDGPGTTFVGYFRMKEETRNILRRITAPGYDPSTDPSDSETNIQKRLTNGVRLWEEWCQRSPTDPSFQARFKLIPQANLTEMGAPSYIDKYNGKPVLIKRNQVTGFLSDYPSLNTMGFDISLHPFPFLFKQAMAYLKENYFDKAIVTFGFVIEGRNDDELPEVVIGAMKVCYPSPKYIVSGEDFFAGTCPKSSSRTM